MKIRFLLTVVLIAGLISSFRGVLHPSEFTDTTLTNHLWGFIANLLFTGALALYSVNSTLRGKALVLSTFLISFVVGSFNLHNEAIIFNVTALRYSLIQMASDVVLFALVALALTYGLSLQEGPTTKFNSRSTTTWIWRIAASTILYVFCYLVAGTILSMTYPPLQEFYAGKIPPLGLIVGTQFIRGFIFSLIGLLFVKTTHLPTPAKATLLGLTFSVLGGIAPLIPHNPLMPFEIRLGHGIEVGLSNFVYGFLIGLILSQKRNEEQIPAPSIH